MHCDMLKIQDGVAIVEKLNSAKMTSVDMNQCMPEMSGALGYIWNDKTRKKSSRLQFRKRLQWKRTHIQLLLKSLDTSVTKQ